MTKLNMPRLNSVFIAGYLLKDPEVDLTNGETPFVNFTMRYIHKFRNKFGQPRENACIVRVFALYRLAESCAKYLSEGSTVLVKGELQNYQRHTEFGDYFNEVQIKAWHIQFLDKRRKFVSDNDQEMNTSNHSPAKYSQNNKDDIPIGGTGAENKSARSDEANASS